MQEHAQDGMLVDCRVNGRVKGSCTASLVNGCEVQFWCSPHTGRSGCTHNKWQCKHKWHERHHKGPPRGQRLCVMTTLQCTQTRLGQTLWMLFVPKVQRPCVSVHLEWRCVTSSSPFTLWRVTFHLRHWGAARSGIQGSRQFTAQSPHPHIRKCANVSD